jgi:hypothetical protein
MFPQAAKNQLKESLRLTSDLLEREWHEYATARDVTDLCAGATDDASKIYFILTWVSSKAQDLQLWAKRATFILRANEEITFSHRSQRRELLKTLLYVEHLQDEADVRSEVAQRMPDVNSHPQMIAQASVFMSKRILSDLISNAVLCRNAIDDTPAESDAEDHPVHDAAPADDLSPIHDKLLKQFQDFPEQRQPGKNAFLFATIESDRLASRLVSMPSPGGNNALWAMIACHLLQDHGTDSTQHAWDKLAASNIKRPTEKDKVGKWTDRLCALWGCLPFSQKAAKHFEDVWWETADRAEHLLQAANVEMECTDLLYLITHLVYVQNAYMTLDLHPSKVEYLRKTFLPKVEEQIRDHFFEGRFQITLNNIELLVELADFLRAVGLPVPRELQSALAQVTASDMLSWLEELPKDVEGAAHTVFLFERRLNPTTSEARKSRVLKLFGTVYANQRAPTVPAQNPNVSSRLRPRKPPQQAEPNMCEQWHAQDSDCPMKPQHQCVNERLRKRQFAATYIAGSTISDAGRGLFAAKAIQQGQFIAEYTGQVFTLEVSIPILNSLPVFTPGQLQEQRPA